jgi:hypothetical protein
MHLAKKFITSLTNFFDFFFKDSVRNNNTCQIWDLVKKKKTFTDTKKRNQRTRKRKEKTQKTRRREM